MDTRKRKRSLLATHTDNSEDRSVIPDLPKHRRLRYPLVNICATYDGSNGMSPIPCISARADDSTNANNDRQQNDSDGYLMEETGPCKVLSNRKSSEFSSWPAYKFTCDHVLNLCATCNRVFHQLGVEETADQARLEKRLYQNVNLYIGGKSREKKRKLTQTVDNILAKTNYREIDTSQIKRVGKQEGILESVETFDPIIIVAKEDDHTLAAEICQLLKDTPAVRHRLAVFLLQDDTEQTSSSMSQHWLNACSVVQIQATELADKIDDFLERYALETIAQKARAMVKIAEILKSSYMSEGVGASQILHSRANLRKTGLQPVCSKTPVDNSKYLSTKEAIDVIDEILQRMIAMYERSNAKLPDHLKTLDLSSKLVDKTVTDTILEIKNVIACGESYGTLHIFVDKDGRGLTRDLREIKRYLGTQRNVVHEISRDIKLLSKVKIGSSVGKSPCSGTLGCFAESNDELFALISKHVAVPYTMLDGNDEDEKQIKLGTCVNAILQKKSTLAVQLDIAAAAIHANDADACDTAFRDDEKQVKECHLFDHTGDPKKLSEMVFLWGAKTKPGRGVIFLSDVQGYESHLLVADREVEGSPNFCQQGDSGAVVCACDRRGKLYALGMISGKYENNPKPEYEGKYSVLKLDAGLNALKESHKRTFSLCNKYK